jgi:hypothetical protein
VVNYDILGGMEQSDCQCVGETIHRPGLGFGEGGTTFNTSGFVTGVRARELSHHEFGHRWGQVRGNHLSGIEVASLECSCETSCSRHTASTGKSSR